MVETLLVTVLFLSAVIFAMVQVSLITINTLISNEAAFSMVRSAVVAKTDSDVSSASRSAAFFLLGPHMSAENYMPLKATVLGKKPLDVEQQDYQHDQIKTYEVDINYAVKLMFSKIIQPFSGPVYTTDATARMIKSPDSEYYTRAYPGASEW